MLWNQCLKIKISQLYRFDPGKNSSKYSENLILHSTKIVLKRPKDKVTEQKLFTTKNLAPKLCHLHL